MDTDKIISELSVLSNRYTMAMQEMFNKYHFDEIRDVRVNIFKHPRIVIDSTYVLFLVRQDNIFKDSWWDRKIGLNLFSKKMTKSDRDIFAFAYDSYVRSAYITMLLFAIEGGFRPIYLSVFGKNPPFKFNEIYKALLHEFNLNEFEPLLRLASNIRNSLHNSGGYTWPDETVTWRNVKYEFKKEENLELDYWETFTVITGDIYVMLEKLIKSPVILQKTTINDSSYNNI